MPPAAPGPTGFPAHLSASGETGMPDYISVWGFTLVSVMAFCWVRDGGGYWRGAFVGAPVLPGAPPPPGRGCWP